MESETSEDWEKCRDCGCDCSIAAQCSRHWPCPMKRKHGEFDKVTQSDADSVARIDIGNECMALREAVSSQQQALQGLQAELEEERSAASSAASEAMSMILRLQREKAEIQMEARQFKRYAEERSTHDQQELLALEDLLYKKEQVIQSLTYEVQAYKYRLMSLGFTESEVDFDQYELPPYEYPPLKCSVIHSGVKDDDNDVDVEKYAFGETPKDHLRRLESRISEMERSPTYSQMDGGDFSARSYLEKKVVVGQSPRWTKHSRKLSADSASLGPELLIDSPRINSSFRKIDEEHSNLKKVDNASEAGEYTNDRVYTIDSGHYAAPYNGFTEFKAGAGAGAYDEYGSPPKDLGNHTDFEDPCIKKLYTRLQALEADRESMRQAIISMRTDKAQLVLLKEIAQQLSKEMPKQRKRTMREPFSAVFKWITSIVLWRNRAHQFKYMFGTQSNNNGLQMLLDKGPTVKSWRYLSSTQLGD